MREKVPGSADEARRSVQSSPAYQWLVTVGLVAFGLIHLLLGWICVQVAFGGGGEASTQGAPAELAAKPLGGFLMVAAAIGMVALTLWQVIEAAVGRTQFSGHRRIWKRLASVGRALVYGGLGLTAARLAVGAGGADSDRAPHDLTAQLMGKPFGQVLVGSAGAVVVTVGVSQIVRGARRRFVEDDLDAGVPAWAKTLGAIGWITKGVALSVAGLLVAYAALTFDPQKAAGLDGALKSLQSAPFGAALLTVMGLGFAAFGIFCFVWSRNARQDRT